jgi:hypothetical protein
VTTSSGGRLSVSGVKATTSAKSTGCCGSPSAPRQARPARTHGGSSLSFASWRQVLAIAVLREGPRLVRADSTRTSPSVARRSCGLWRCQHRPGHVRRRRSHQEREQRQARTRLCRCMSNRGVRDPFRATAHGQPSLDA